MCSGMLAYAPYIIFYSVLPYFTRTYYVVQEHTLLCVLPPIWRMFCRGPDGPDGVDCRAPGSWLAVGLVLAMLTSITIVTTRRLTLAILVTAAVLLNFTTPPSSSFMPPHSFRK